MKDEQVVVLLSGGLDSTTALYYARTIARSRGVVALGVSYGQNHRKELDFASATCQSLGIEFVRVQVPIGFGASALVRSAGEIPDGHYAEASMTQTVVPNRNMVMISLAGSLAESRQSSLVMTAIHAGDHFIYPDCRPGFARAMNEALAEATENRVRLSAPFIRMTKEAIVRLGAGMAVDYSLTWSCYKGGEKHCSTCGTCFERREAFELAGVADPTEYDLTPREWIEFKEAHRYG